MKTNIGGGPFHLTKGVLIFSIILLLSCTSTSVMRLEGSDFKKNLPGFWVGNWYWQSESGRARFDIIKIDGNKVQIEGYAQRSGSTVDTDVVHGRIENSTLLLTWPSIGCQDEYKMIRDNSNNLILDGRWKCESADGTSQLKKIEWK